MSFIKREELPLRLRFRWLWTRICFIATFLVVCIGTYGSLSATPSGRQLEQTAKGSSSALQTLMSDILDAVKTRGRQAEQLIGSLVMENDAPWFAAQFSAETGELLRAAY